MTFQQNERLLLQNHATAASSRIPFLVVSNLNDSSLFGTKSIKALNKSQSTKKKRWKNVIEMNVLCAHKMFESSAANWRPNKISSIFIDSHSSEQNYTKPSLHLIWNWNHSQRYICWCFLDTLWTLDIIWPHIYTLLLFIICCITQLNANIHEIIR